MEDEFLGFSEEYDNACDKENNADDETEKDVVVCSSEALETGFLNLTQMQPCTNEMSKGVVLEPRSKFERILKNLGVEVLFDESMKEFFRIGGDLNHAMWTRKLEAYMQDKAKKSELLTHFEEEVKTSASLLLCLAPTASSFGRQDTMFRAFLLCKSSQSKAFEVLMTALNDLATSNEENSKELAFACVSQIRYLEVSYDNQAIYQSVFDSKFDTWNPTTRDAFISALPEILTDPCAQQEAALELKDMLRSEVASAASFQTAILNSLNLLRMQPSVATEVRKFLCVNCMHVDATILPLITNFSLASISTDPSASFLDFLNDFSKFLKLDNLRTLRQSRGHLGTDSIVAATFASIMRYVQLDKKAWKSLSVFLCRNIDETENPEPDVGTSSKPRKYELFDLMLLFASLSSYGCPPAVLNHLKTCLTANPAVTDQFINLCKNALSFRKFRSEYLTAFISCARQCVWSLDENLRSFGSFIYKKLLVLTEKTNQQNVFEELLSHFSRGDVECSCVLEILNMVAEEHYNAIRDFIPLIQKCLDLIHTLSLDNVKSLFRVLLMICSKNDDLNLKKDINYLIMAYLSSHNEQERMWGIIGKTVQIDLLLQSRESNRESLMQAYLDDIERCLQGDAPLRSAFYRLFAQVLQNNGRSMPSPYILKWADVKETMFKKEFFVDKTAGVESTSALESEKFVRKECGFWLQPPPERMRELVAFFELLKEVSMMKRRWNTDEDSFNANVNHFAAFFYAFEANISMEAVTSLKEIDKIKATVDYLFFVNDWIRMLLNTFSSRSSVPGHPDEVIQEIWTKKFFLLFECEKQINTRIKQIEKWTLPTESTTDCFVVRQQAPKNSSKKKVERRGKKRPRESDEHNSMNEPINSPEPEEMFVDITTSLSDAKTRKPLTFIDLKDFNFHLRPLKLAAVVRLILMVDEKRKSTLFLLDELLRILRDQISKKEKKPGIWLHKNNKPKVSSDYHGDHTTVWKLVKKCIPVVWKIANSMTKFFEEQLETSIVDRHDPAILAQTSQLLARCLQIVHAIFSSSETARPRENEEGFTSRRNKRSEMIETLEKSIMDMQEQEENESPDEAEEDPEHRISQIFFKMAHVALSSEVAIAVLDAFSCFDVASPDMSLKMAKSALGYLRREWSDEEGNALKGPSLSNAAKSILDHYIRLRRDEKQLTAIHSLLSDKIASLVPKGEKEKNNAYGALPQDDELDEDDMRGNFACINVKTFPAIYKVLFRWVNVCMSRKNMRSNVIRNGSHTEEQVLNMWDSAAACFSLLCLFLRVPQLRALPALTTAVREGKRFLTLIAKNNSFTYLLEDLPQGARFIAIEPRISKIIRAVQMGNGVLQNIGVYAKTKKCNNLLKALPELRGASEMCLRHMHTIMVANNCTDAFDIGMMKSRNLDGKVMEVEQSEDSDAESENDPAQNDGNQDEEGNDDENDDGEDSDSRESAVF